MTEQAKIRRLQDRLNIAGTGVIAFSVWSLAKIGLFISFADQDTLRTLLGITGAMLVNTIFVLVAAMGIIDLCVRVFVGVRDSLGRHRSDCVRRADDGHL